MTLKADPGVIPGGNAADIEESQFAGTGQGFTASPGAQKGVFADFPGVTPKYAKNDNVAGNARDAEYRDTMARLFLDLPASLWKQFRDSLPNDGSREIADVLAVRRDQDGTAIAGAGYIDFLLQNVQHNLQEKAHIVDVLADNFVVFYFGQQPPVWSFSGTFMNTWQDDWLIRFLKMYRNITRGTQLARRNTLVRIRYDSLILSGTMMNLQWQLNAANETAVPFSFNFLVHQMIPLPTDDGQITDSRSSVAAPDAFINDPRFSLEELGAQDKRGIRTVSPLNPAVVQERRQAVLSLSALAAGDINPLAAINANGGQGPAAPARVAQVRTGPLRGSNA